MRIRGRFRTKDLARIVFRHARVPLRNGRPCDRGTVVYNPRRPHRIPFRDCASHKAKTVLSGPTGRIFQQTEWDDRVDLWETLAYGCLFSTNKGIRLGVDDPNSGEGDLSLFRLAGPYVAFAEDSFFGAEGAINLMLVDLRTGTREPLDGLYPRDVALKDTGAAAWVGQAQLPDGARGTFGVYADDSTGRDRLLDSGSGIDVDSLELNGSTLTWVKDGTTHSATLN